MIRLLAALLCACAARRWPRLWFVVTALASEHFAHELVSHAGALAPMAWASSSIVATCVGASFGTMPGRTSSFAAALHTIASMFAPSESWQLAFVCGSSWLTYIVLLMRTVPRDIERCIVAVMLAGNATTAALTLAVGIDAAYASDVVSASNNVIHACIAGLALWAIRSR